MSNLYLGNRVSTTIASELGIDTVISIGPRSKSTDVEVIHIGLTDNPLQNIRQYLNQITQDIHTRIQENTYFPYYTRKVDHFLI